MFICYASYFDKNVGTLQNLKVLVTLSPADTCELVSDKEP